MHQVVLKTRHFRLPPILLMKVQTESLYIRYIIARCRCEKPTYYFPYNFDSDIISMKLNSVELQNYIRYSISLPAGTTLQCSAELDKGLV